MKRATASAPRGLVGAVGEVLTTVGLQGTDRDSLIRSVGHDAGTPLPGLVGDVAVAGHRTTSGRPRTDDAVQLHHGRDRTAVPGPHHLCPMKADS